MLQSWEVEEYAYQWRTQTLWDRLRKARDAWEAL